MKVLMAILACVLGLVAAGVQAQVTEVKSIYGIHDHSPAPTEYLNSIKNKVGGGWVTATVAVGHNPNETWGEDFRSISNAGHTVICRINNGYGSAGTIPTPDKYDAFAQRVASFVQNSQGCNIWVIGNETNLASEWPLNGDRFSYVSPQEYAIVFRKVYNAIKAVRPNDKVLPQALAPWAGPYGPGVKDGHPHDGVPINWVQYKRQMLEAIKATGGLDGIAVHINSRGYSYSDIHSTAKVNANGQNLYFSFYVYKDWVDYGIPQSLYHLPIYATECNGYFYWKGGFPEDPSKQYEAGWMQEIYAEIDRYNQQAALTGKPIYRAVNMYRWCGYCDGWNIDMAPNKNLILSDLDAALDQNYMWPDPGIIVDNTNQGFTVQSGTWSTATISTDKFGSNYRFASSGTGASVVRWTAQLPNSGMYEVFVWYPQGSNRTPNAPYTVAGLDGNTTVRVDQRTGGGGWRSIGTYPFSQGSASVSLSNDCQPSVVLADAVRWLYKEPLPNLGAIQGFVRDNQNRPIADATVFTNIGGHSVTSGPDGAYSMAPVNPGSYSVRAQRPGFVNQTFTGVGVAGFPVTLNFNLNAIRSPVSIPAAKAWTDGNAVTLSGKVVSRARVGDFWLQELDRTSGIRVLSSANPAPGTLLDVVGILATEGSERYLNNSTVFPAGQTLAPTPLHLLTSALGGPALNSATPGISQPGGSAVNNVGLFVAVTGRVTGQVSGVIYVDDGKGLTDGSGFSGVRVRLPQGMAPPAVGATVTARGISRLDSTFGPRTGAVEVISPLDLTVH